MKHRLAPTLPLAILLALVLPGCADDENSGPACSYPAELPVSVDRPDGGELRLFQTANGEIAGSERDTFTVDAYCEPSWGYEVTIQVPSGSAIDIAYSIVAFGQRFETNYWGPGIGEGSTLVIAYADPVIPFEIRIEVWSANGEPGTYSISINPDPMPT